MLLNGIAAGLTFMPAASLVVGGVKPEHAGSASGLLQTSQQLGGAIGLAVVVSVYAAGAVPGAHAAFLTTVAFTMVAFIVTVLAVHPNRNKAAKTAYSSPVGGERHARACPPLTRRTPLSGQQTTKCILRIVWVTLCSGWKVRISPRMWHMAQMTIWRWFHDVEFLDFSF
ncbi:MFS transporter [Streptomyces sp. NPDC059757]|uniref:MFS transporter n=1 Tax=Streptomyces sp. NPDC059757 TaxID=3346935 RepID=UPI00364C4DAD